MQTIPRAKGFTIYIADNGPTVSIHGHKHNVQTVSYTRTVIHYITQSDAHRKIFGHIMLILLGLAIAAAEIALNFSAIMITVTQVILPAIVQEAYDFHWKL